MTAGSKDRLELVALEVRVDELIKAVESLATENEALRSQQASLTTVPLWHAVLRWRSVFFSPFSQQWMVHWMS